ncbi:radical SAM protein [Streptomyces sp. NPDC006704]|uniref:radical SAM protein n=1 Tax=Streptomyces sp. NPDC006704 TaxID=3364760 RepID=UPI00368CB9E3
MHSLIASPFLEDHLLVRPGARGGLMLPPERYEELRTYAVDAPAPGWLVDAVTGQWPDLEPAGPLGGLLMVRQPSAWGYSRASWEINLGCNYKCKHCYLGLKVNSGMPLADKLACLQVMAEAGVLWLQITGGEPTVDKDFISSYRVAYALGMMITVSMYGAAKASYEELTQRQGAWDLFIQGMNAARRAKLPLRMSVIVTEDNAHEEQAMVRLCEGWGLEYSVFTNLTPTIYGGGEVLTAQSKEHLRMRRPFGGCNAGHTFFHTDPHGLVSICKIGRDDQINLPAEGIGGLARLGAIADRLMLRTGGCSGCQLSGTCTVCRPLAKHYQEAKAPLGSYCQHGFQKAG